MKKYRVKFTNGKTGVLFSHDFTCGSPISALNQAHRLLQEDFGHRNYQIKSLAHVYYDGMNGVTGNVVESEFDLPKMENPDLMPNAAPVEETVGMESILNHTGGKLAD